MIVLFIILFGNIKQLWSKRHVSIPCIFATLPKEIKKTIVSFISYFYDLKDFIEYLPAFYCFRQMKVTLLEIVFESFLLVFGWMIFELSRMIQLAKRECSNHRSQT